MKAIQTRFLPFTNHKPARIKASAEGVKSIIYSIDWLDIHGSSLDCNHTRAAKDFAKNNQWPTSLASGQLANGDFVHCFIPDKYTADDIQRHKRIAKDAIGF